MATPEEEYAALMQDWDVVWAEQSAALLAVIRKQMAVAQGRRDNPSLAQEERLEAARAAVKKVQGRIDEFMARHGYTREWRSH